MWLEKQRIEIDNLDLPPSRSGEIVESTKDFLFNLMYGCVTGDAWEKFLAYYEKLPEDEVDIKEFKEKLEEFKMNNPTIRHIYY